jgi:hypothetical protein
MHVGLVGVFGADIEETLLDQLAYLRGDDPAGNLGITRTSMGSRRTSMGHLQGRQGMRVKPIAAACVAMLSGQLIGDG